MKTAFEKWIEANNALQKCFEGVNAERFNALSHKDQDALCHDEREAVKSFLTNNQITFASILKERLASAGHK